MPDAVDVVMPIPHADADWSPEPAPEPPAGSRRGNAAASGGGASSSGGRSTPSEEIVIPISDQSSGPQEFNIGTPPRTMPEEAETAPGMRRGGSAGDLLERRPRSPTPSPPMPDDSNVTRRRRRKSALPHRSAD